MGQLTKICLLAATTMSIGAAHASPWPTGTQDTATAVYNEEITIPVLDNDSGEGLKLVSVNAWSTNLGRAVITEDNKIQYKQVGHIRGDISDEFWYVFEDEQGRTNAAKVVVSVSQEVVVSTPWPTAALDSVTIIRDEAITVDVLSNDTGEGLELTASNDWTNKGGRTVIVDNQVRYTPPSSFIGTDWFWYNFKDSEGRTNSQKVIVKVTPPPSAYPRANPDAVESKNGLRVFIPVLDNDTGEGLKLTASNEWTQKGGRTAIVDGIIRYTPPVDFTGTDVFWYDFEDNQGRTNSTKVTVEVTQNTEFSMVEFCGNTYQTDGTKENTTLTNLIPVESEDEYLLMPYISGRLVMSDRRNYYLEGNDATAKSVVASVDGRITKLATSPVGEPLSILGAYNNHLYFVQDKTLYAHDGEVTTNMGFLFDGIDADTSEYGYYFVRGNITGNSLYIKATIAGPGFEHTNEWRISDGLDLNPFWVERVKRDPNGDYTTATTLALTKAATYFNGFEYDSSHYAQEIREDTIGHKVDRKYLGEVLDTINTDLWNVEFVENNDRLFILGEVAPAPGPYDNGNGWVGDKKLYVVNNKDDSFVELASCDAASED